MKDQDLLRARLKNETLQIKHLVRLDNNINWMEDIVKQLNELIELGDRALGRVK